MFKITEGKGFHMTFANGWTVSVQWGQGNYCENRYKEVTKNLKCSDAEVAAWDKNGIWHRFEHDSVEGHLSANEVAEFISMIAAKE